MFSFNRPSTSVFLLFVITLVFCYVFQTVRNVLNDRKIRSELGCKPVLAFPQRPLLGLDTALRSIQVAKCNQLLETSRARFQQIAVSTFSMKVLGRTVVYTKDPMNLKTIMATGFSDWSLPRKRKDAFAPVIGHGIFTLDGEPWKHSREMLKPNFAKSQTGNLDMLAKHVDSLVYAADQEMQASGIVELGHIFFRLTTDSATELLFGEGTHFLEDPKERFAEAFDGALDFVGFVSRVGSLAYLFKPSKVKEYDQYLYKFVDHYVDQAIARRQDLQEKKAEEGESERYTFVNELARQTGDRKRIRSELLNILLAGRDTTASLLTNTWWVLARRPDIFARLRTEINTLKGDEISLESLKSLKYLRAVLNECLRLYPVVPLNSREATAATTLPRGGGEDETSPVFIPAGATVVWSLYAMHRDPNLYGVDAEEFKPDRWIDDPEDEVKGLRPGWEYLPFNGGPRICLGQNFALNEASYTTVRLCQEFAAVEAGEDQPWTEMLTVTCVNKHGAKVSLKRDEV